MTAHQTSKDVTVDELANCSDEYLRHKYGTNKSDAAPGETLPVILERDFRHDPIEGEQGVLEMLVEIEDGCPVCGYDRAHRTIITLAGEAMDTCQACEAYLD